MESNRRGESFDVRGRSDAANTLAFTRGPQRWPRVGTDEIDVRRSIFHALDSVRIGALSFFARCARASRSRAFALVRARARHGVGLHPLGEWLLFNECMTLRSEHSLHRPLSRERPRCGAKCRDGHACKAPAVWIAGEPAPRNGRCRMHGGLSTGPRSREGWARTLAALSAWRERNGLAPLRTVERVVLMHAGLERERKRARDGAHARPPTTGENAQ